MASKQLILAAGIVSASLILSHTLSSQAGLIRSELRKHNDNTLEQRACHQMISKIDDSYIYALNKVKYNIEYIIGGKHYWIDYRFGEQGEFKKRLKDFSEKIYKQNNLKGEPTAIPYQFRAEYDDNHPARLYFQALESLHGKTLLECKGLDTFPILLGNKYF